MNQKDLQAADDWMMKNLSEELVIEDSEELKSSVRYLCFNEVSGRSVTFTLEVCNGQVQVVSRGRKVVFSAE